MNKNIRLILCVSVLYVLVVESESSRLIEPEIEEYSDVKPVAFFDIGKDRQVPSTVYKTLNKYYCSLDSTIEGSHLIVYGSKGWTFPVQDVNLTLRYPQADKAVNETFDSSIQDDLSFEKGDEDYLVSGFKVILYIDGPRSVGYITDGGVLQDSITLSFVISQITSLRYEFWLYGVRRDTLEVIEVNSHYRLCY